MRKTTSAEELDAVLDAVLDVTALHLLKSRLTLPFSSQPGKHSGDKEVPSWPLRRSARQ